MSKIKDGGPAFPIPQQQFSDGEMIVSSQGWGGMSLRDYFAAQALIPCMNHFLDEPQNEEIKTREKAVNHYAKMAYFMADAMLTARKVKS